MGIEKTNNSGTILPAQSEQSSPISTRKSRRAGAIASAQVSDEAIQSLDTLYKIAKKAGKEIAVNARNYTTAIKSAAQRFATLTDPLERAIDSTKVAASSNNTSKYLLSLLEVRDLSNQNKTSESSRAINEQVKHELQSLHTESLAQISEDVDTYLDDQGERLGTKEINREHVNTAQSFLQMMQWTISSGRADTKEEALQILTKDFDRLKTDSKKLTEHYKEFGISPAQALEIFLEPTAMQKGGVKDGGRAPAPTNHALKMTKILIAQDDQEKLAQKIDIGAQTEANLDLADTFRSEGFYIKAEQIYESVLSDRFKEQIKSVSQERKDEITKEVHKELDVVFNEVSESLERLRDDKPVEYLRMFPESMSSADKRKKIALMVDQAANTKINAKIKKASLVGLDIRHDLGELSNSESRAWSAYDDMLNPIDKLTNITDRGWDIIADEVVLSAITMPISMGVGTAVRATRASAIALRVANVGGRITRYSTRLGIHGVAIAAESAADVAMRFSLNGNKDELRGLKQSIFTSIAFQAGGRSWGKIGSKLNQVAEDANIVSRSIIKLADIAGTLGTQTAIGFGIGEIEAQINRHGQEGTAINRAFDQFSQIIAYHYGSKVIDLATGHWENGIETTVQEKMHAYDSAHESYRKNDGNKIATPEQSYARIKINQRIWNNKPGEKIYIYIKFYEGKRIVRTSSEINPNIEPHAIIEHRPDGSRTIHSIFTNPVIIGKNGILDPVLLHNGDAVIPSTAQRIHLNEHYIEIPDFSPTTPIEFAEFRERLPNINTLDDLKSNIMQLSDYALKDLGGNFSRRELVSFIEKFYSDDQPATDVPIWLRDAIKKVRTHEAALADENKTFLTPADEGADIQINHAKAVKSFDKIQRFTDDICKKLTGHENRKLANMLEELMNGEFIFMREIVALINTGNKHGVKSVEILEKLITERMQEFINSVEDAYPTAMHRIRSEGKNPHNGEPINSKKEDITSTYRAALHVLREKSKVAPVSLNEDLKDRAEKIIDKFFPGYGKEKLDRDYLTNLHNEFITWTIDDSIGRRSLDYFMRKADYYERSLFLRMIFHGNPHFTPQSEIMSSSSAARYLLEAFGKYGTQREVATFYEYDEQTHSFQVRLSLGTPSSVSGEGGKFVSDHLHPDKITADGQPSDSTFGIMPSWHHNADFDIFQRTANRFFEIVRKRGSLPDGAEQFYDPTTKELIFRVIQGNGRSEVRVKEQTGGNPQQFNVRYSRTNERTWFDQSLRQNIPITPNYQYIDSIVCIEEWAKSHNVSMRIAGDPDLQ